MQTRVIKASGQSGPWINEIAGEAAAELMAGKLVGFATETVYGIAAVATNAPAMERLRELKSRPSRPFSVHIAGTADVGRYVSKVPAAAARLMAKSWPGPITLLLPVGGRLADEKLQRAGMYDALCSEDYIGLRCPDEPLAGAMLASVSEPVVAPSANLSGKRSPRTAEEVLDGLGGRIDLLLDTGPTQYGTDSTIVKIDADGWSVVRSGVLDERAVRRIMRKTYLFVCSGNTCRSPIAAGLARKVLAERIGCDVGELRKHDIDVVSAGVYAMDGQRVTPESVAAAAEYGVDISKHRSRQLTTELINSADFVFCMTESHVAEVCRIAPSASSKVRRLDSGGDITDPIGGGGQTYRQTAQGIYDALVRSLAE